MLESERAHAAQGITTRTAQTARLFTVTVLVSLAVVTRASESPSAAVVPVVAILAAGLTAWTSIPGVGIASLEGGLAAMAVVLAFPDQALIVPYLAVPPLVAALDRGRRGVISVLALELVILLMGWGALSRPWDAESAANAVTWAATAIGLGILGAALRQAANRSESETSYRSALTLIRRLVALSDKLSGGLDAIETADQVMALAERSLATRHLGVLLVGDDGGLTPLRYSSGTEASSLFWSEPLAQHSVARQEWVLRGDRAALPLRVDDRPVAVLVVEGVQTLGAAEVRELDRQLGPLSLQLQAALLFGKVQAAATSRERQRIAREVHDGVAQDIASLGYLVDNLTEGTEDPGQRARAQQLRQELTRVVTELRYSIFDLRQAVSDDAGLGESISAHARQVGATSPLTVHVTLDESDTRLPADVEHELLRIAQEAMNNARKHSGGEHLWVSLRVDAPWAELEVRDDGQRAHEPAPDSQGLRIMSERAAGIGAAITVSAATDGARGTTVHVSLGAAPANLRAGAGQEPSPGRT